MKKLILCSILALAGFGLWAQQMDTIHWGNPYYYWDAFLNPDSLDLNDYLDPVDSTSGSEQGFINLGNLYSYKRFDIGNKDSMVITGVALPVRSIVPHATDSLGGINRLITCNGPLVDFIDLKFFLPNSTSPVDSFHITTANVRSIAQHNKILTYNYLHTGIPDLASFNRPQFDTLWEFFFEEPVTVTGEFWIGLINYSAIPMGDAQCYMWAPFASDYWVGINYYQAFIPSSTGSQSFPDYPMAWNKWQQPQGRVFLPIIQPEIDSIDFACETPRKPQLLEADHLGHASIAWPRPNVSFGLELSLFPDGGDPDQGAIATLNPNSTALRLDTLTPGATYAVALRNICRHHCLFHDTTWYSDWSDTLRFTLPLPGHDTVWNTDTLWVNDSTYIVGGELIVLDSNATIFEQGGHIYIILGTDTLDYDDPRLIWIDDHTAVLGGTLVVISSGTPDQPQGILSPDGATILRREYYDLLGRRVAKPQKGIYLERTVTTQGVTTRKIIKH